MRKSVLVKKICYWLAAICVVIGIITIFPAMSMVKNGTKVAGTISAVHEDITYESDGNVIQHYPDIDYVDPITGQEMTYSSDVNVGINKYQIGDTVELLLTEKDGEPDARIYTSMTIWTGLMVMLIMAALIAIIGVVFDHNRAKKTKLMNSLKSTGTELELPITEIRKETVKSRGQAVNVSITFYVMDVKWTSPEGKEFVFKSENIARHPSEFGKDVGSMVTVYFDVANPAKHYIDVSFVPEKDLF